MPPLPNVVPQTFRRDDRDLPPQNLHALLRSPPVVKSSRCEVMRMAYVKRDDAHYEARGSGADTRLFFRVILSM